MYREIAGPQPGWHGDRSSTLRELALTRLVDRLPAAVYVAESGAAGRWNYVSPQIRDILGFAPADFIADPLLWASLLHPDDRDRVLLADGAGQPSGRSQLEYRMVGRSGRLVWVLDDAVLDRGLQHGMLFDITGRKRTEMMLAGHAGIVERVARGEDVRLTLCELAAATEAVCGAGQCIIDVGPDAGVGRRTLIGRDGELAGCELTELPPARYRRSFTDPDGTALGEVGLHYPPGAPAVPADAELADWAAGLAAIAVVRSAEHARVTSSMSLLEATLESTADGILVISLGGRVIGFNQKMVDLWRLDPRLLAQGRDDELRASVLHQLVDPDGFNRQVERLMATPLEYSHDEVQFLDGRFFERYSQPQLVDGRPVGRVWSFRDMTLHRQLEQELRAQAFADPLTGLANRGYFIQQLTAMLGSSVGSASPPALLLLDLDDFKTVNDSLGHVVGDALLMAVAERLQGCLGPGQLAARLGGDEFVVLLEQPDGGPAAVEVAEQVAAQILDAVSRPRVVEGQSLIIQASIGIAVPEPGENGADLLRNADLAMYTAKREGGGRCHRYRPAMHASAMARLALKADLERAIETGELAVHYQPVVDLHSLQIVSVEALVRWCHPVRGAIPPQDFIALAEESRLIDRLGAVVLKQACAQVAQWRRELPSASRLTASVNVSPRQLSDPTLCEQVRAALSSAGLPPSGLVLEITESCLATPNVDVVGVLQKLKRLGVSLALDDFGVGYSSLGHLINFPLDIVKVDKSFAERLTGEQGGTALLRAVLQVAQALSLAATIEGVETHAQLEKVIALGCARAQGFLLSPPLDVPAATEVLSRRIELNHDVEVAG